MSTEVNCINGGNSEIHRQQQESLTDGMENHVILTTTPASVKSIVAEETDFFPETTGTSSYPAGTTCSSSGPGSRSQKSKKRQNQKTFSLTDIFDMHKGIGSWADAAAADAHTTSYSLSATQESSETKQVSSSIQRASASQQGDWNHFHSADGNMRLSSLDLDRMTRSRNVDLTNLPDRPPFEVKVANINYKSSDSDLFSFFGGKGNVVNIRSEGQATRRGIAVVSLSSQEALINALKLNNMELQGRSLRISLRDHQSRPSFGSARIPLQNHQSRSSFNNSNVGINNAYGHCRNNDSCHEGGYSTLPHPRRGPAQVPYHAYSSVGRANRLPLQHCPSYRGRGNRRYDYDDRQFRNPKPGSNQFSPRFTNRGSDSYGLSSKASTLNENHLFHHNVEIEHDADKRGPERIRTESARSNTADGTEKQERRKLQLQPRTKPLDTGDDLPARPTNIFGLAKPVDTYEKEKQAEERLRLEYEAFKAAEQRSRKSSERTVSVPASPLLFHGQVSLETKCPLRDVENSPLSVQKTVSGTNCKSVEDGETVRTSASLQLVTNEERVVGQTETVVTTLASTLQPPISLPEPSLSTARRQSYSNGREMSKTRASSTLLRTRNSYNRTFTRSRDSVRIQFPPNKLHNISVRRGKSGSRHGGTNSGGLGLDKDKHVIVNRERIAVEGNSDGSSVEPGLPNGPEQIENRSKLEHQSISKEEKRGLITTPNASTTTEQSWQQHSDQHYSKRDKKKQTTTAREMPKYVEPNPLTFLSENKYAALSENKYAALSEADD